MTKTITSLGYEMDTSPEAFGELRASNDISDNPEALRERMQADGYVFLRDCLNVDDVMTARREILTRIEAGGGLAAGHSLMDGISPPDVNRDPFDHKLARHNDQLSGLLYNGPLMSYFDRFLGHPHDVIDARIGSPFGIRCARAKPHRRSALNGNQAHDEIRSTNIDTHDPPTHRNPPKWATWARAASVGGNVMRSSSRFRAVNVAKK